MKLLTSAHDGGTINAIDASEPLIEATAHGDLPAPTPEGLQRAERQIYLCVCMAAIGGFLFGYDTGIVSGAMLLIIKDLELQGDTFKQELIVSATLVGCIISALAAKTITEKLGRKPAVTIGSVVFTVGAALMGGSGFVRPWAFEILVLGRFVIGLAVGLASMAIPMYIAELSPPGIRGKLLSLNIVFITGGQFISCLVAGSLSQFMYPRGWQLMLGLAGVPSLIQLAGMALAPESPRWLARYKGKEEARVVLQRLRASRAEANQELQEILESIAEEDKQNQEAFGFSDLLGTPALRQILLLACMLQAIQQLSGINTVMYYSGTIVVMAGFTNVSLAIWLTAAISFVGFAFTFLGMFLVERAGRRCLTLGSLLGVAAFLGLLGFSFYMMKATSPAAQGFAGSDACQFKTCYDCVFDSQCGYCQVPGADSGFCFEGNETDPVNATAMQLHCGKNGTYHGQSCPVDGFDYGVLSLVGVAGYLGFFQAGMGQMPWTVNSEIFPLKARSAGISAATTVNWVCNLLVSFTFLDLCKDITTYGAFWLYAGISLVGLAFFAVKLPETRGKSLEEIQEFFR